VAGQLNLLQLGDEEAHYLGVNVPRAAVVAAVQRAAGGRRVAISGIIGFIGLVVPHLMRLWLGADHRALVPGSLLAGAMLLLIADTLARTVVAPRKCRWGCSPACWARRGSCGLSSVREGAMVKCLTAEHLSLWAGRAG
jgi:ABC-type Fe3+-siderophore transport system permease subunit